MEDTEFVQRITALETSANLWREKHDEAAKERHEETKDKFDAIFRQLAKLPCDINAIKYGNIFAELSKDIDRQNKEISIIKRGYWLSGLLGGVIGGLLATNSPGFFTLLGKIIFNIK